MANQEDKGKTSTSDQSAILGRKPYSSIGPGRTAEEAAIVGKLKKKKANSLVAEGSTQEDGETANVGKVSKAIGSFVNR